MTLPDSWVETPLRNAESISRVLAEFAESRDGLGWPETSPYYLDIEALAVFQGVKLFWIDREGPNPQEHLTTIRASTSPLGVDESLQTIAESVAKSVEEDEDEELISIEQMQTPAGTVVEIQLEHTNTYREGNPKNRVVMYYLVSGPTLYTLKFETPAEGAEAYIPMLRQIAESFTLLQPLGQGPTQIVLPTVAPTTTARSSPTQALAEPTSVPATPEAKPVGEGGYDGTWAGKTSQGQEITLKIRDNAIVEFSVQFDPAVCGSGMMSDFESTPLTENTFEKAFTIGATRLLLVTGSVDASGTMTGAITADKTMLCEPTTLQWSATR